MTNGLLLGYHDLGLLMQSFGCICLSYGMSPLLLPFTVEGDDCNGVSVFIRLLEMKCSAVSSTQYVRSHDRMILYSLVIERMKEKS